MDGSTFYSFSQVELIGLLNTLNLNVDDANYHWLSEAQKILINTITSEESIKKDVLKSIDRIIKSQVYLELSLKIPKLNKLIRKVVNVSRNHLDNKTIMLLQHLLYSLLCNYYTNKISNKEFIISFSYDYTVKNELVSSVGKSQREMKYMKLLIKSFLFYLFSSNINLYFNWNKNSVNNKNKEYPCLLKNFELMLFIKDYTYNSYLTKQLKKLLLFKGIYRNANSELVYRYINYLFREYSFNKDDEYNILNRVFNNCPQSDYYYFLILLFSMSELSEENNKHLKLEFISKNLSNKSIKMNFTINIFGDYMVNKNKFIEFFLIDQYNSFSILNSIKTGIILQSFMNGQNKPQLLDQFSHSLFYALFFQRYYILSNKEIRYSNCEKALYGKQLNDYPLTNQKDENLFIIQHFKDTSLYLLLYKINNNQIQNLLLLQKEIEEINDFEGNIMILSLLKQLFRCHLIYPQEDDYHTIQNEIIRLANTVNEKTLLLMCKTKVFNITYLNFILESFNDIHLLYPINDTNYFFKNASMNMYDYTKLYYHFQIFYINYCVMNNISFEQFNGIMIKGFKAYNDKVIQYLYQKNYNQILIMYLVLNLNYLEMVLFRQKKLRLILPYCMFCYKKYPKTKKLLSKFMIYCSYCNKCSLIVNIDNTSYFVNQTEEISKNNSIYIEVVKDFFQRNLNKVIDIAHDNYINHKLLLILTQFLMKFSKKKELFNIRKDIIDFINQYQETEITTDMIKKLMTKYDYYKIRQIIKWKEEINQYYII